MKREQLLKWLLERTRRKKLKQFGDSVEVIGIDVTKDGNLLNNLIKESDIVIR